MAKIFQINENCIGCGMCHDIAEDYFQLGDDGRAVVTNQPENEEGINLCNEALSSCPVEAIIEEDK